MGANNALRVYQNYGHLGASAKLALIRIALTVHDTEKRPGWWGGHQALLEAVRGPQQEADRRPLTETERKAANRLVQQLVQSGALTPVKAAGPGSRARYAVEFGPALKRTDPAGVAPIDRGTESGSKAGQFVDELGTQSGRTRDTKCPPDELQEVEEKQASVDADRRDSLAAGYHLPEDQAAAAGHLLAKHPNLDEATAVAAVVQVAPIVHSSIVRYVDKLEPGRIHKAAQQHQDAETEQARRAEVTALRSAPDRCPHGHKLAADTCPHMCRSSAAEVGHVPAGGAR